MLNESEKKVENSDGDPLVEEKLSCLNAKNAKAVKRIPKNRPEAINTSFEDLRPSTVSIIHCFELKLEISIYQTARNVTVL